MDAQNVSPILITGGSQRIGLALAQYLRSQGYPIIVTYRQEKSSLALLKDQGVECIQADFSEPNGIRAFIELIKQQHSSLRAIIHNASEWLPEKAEAKTTFTQQFDDLNTTINRMLAIHVHAPFHINFALASLLNRSSLNAKTLSKHPLNEKATSEASPAPGSRDIIHLTDFVAQCGSAKHIAYAASKAALENMTLSFAKRLSPTIKVNSIAPAMLMFNEHDSLDYREKAKQKSVLPPAPGPEEAINAVNFLMNSQYITGRCIELDGGRHLLTP